MDMNKETMKIYPLQQDGRKPMRITIVRPVSKFIDGCNGINQFCLNNVGV